MPEYPKKALAWFTKLSTSAKAAVVAGVAALAAILAILVVSISPLLIYVALAATALYGFLALRQYGRNSDPKPEIKRALACGAAALLFVALSNIFHDDSSEFPGGVSASHNLQTSEVAKLPITL